MRRDFTHYEDLLNCVQADKQITGALAGKQNRYPIRFVLFDNFHDSYQFITYLQDGGCKFKSVNDWLEVEFPDMILTYSELSDNIKRYALSHTDDCVITPFSELARFYNNEDAKEFDALVKTIKGIENNSAAIAKNRRIYIPLVGLEGKMSLFENDTQSTIWYLKNNDKSLCYDLILSNGTDYGVQGLAKHYNVVSNVYEWLEVWKTRPAVTPIIICTSKAIYANKEYAQPDNAFKFEHCDCAFDFLVRGLKLNFGDVVYKVEEECFWQRLASEIQDISQGFSFEKFFNSYFHIDNLADTAVFLKLWFECKDEFEKWLLVTYYKAKFCNSGYICQVLNQMAGYSNVDFFTAIALTIFAQEPTGTDVYDRSKCLYAAYKHQVHLTQETESRLTEKLEQLAKSIGYRAAIVYFSPLTLSEKHLAIQWLAEGYISRDNLIEFFPDLFYYLENNKEAEPWINEYFNAYKKAKVSNTYTPDIAEIIQQKNASALTFQAWYQDILTTKTILNEREDIDVYYWIDGLGVDWIPYIKHRIEQHSEPIYVNEIHIARALYPTTTQNNKVALQELSKGKLIKCGDLDNHAHLNANTFPQYIIEELEIVNKAIDTILTNYSGKKIAIISDHGLTALSQLCDGLNLIGVESDHHGRLAIRTSGNMVASDDYIVCEDNKTMCALRHRSLCGKVPTGQSAHGGCTIEEILVPIFVISSQKEIHKWTATLLSDTITESQPVVKYKIKGLSNVETPKILYAGKQYALISCGNDIYESERLQLSASAQEIILVIGDKQQKNPIKVVLSVEEDDYLFDF